MDNLFGPFTQIIIIRNIIVIHGQIAFELTCRRTFLNTDWQIIPQESSRRKNYGIIQFEKKVWSFRKVDVDGKDWLLKQEVEGGLRDSLDKRC